MKRDEWIGLPAIARVSGLSRKAINKAVCRSLADDNYLWRGQRLIIRFVHGKGGASGKQHQVCIDSLPPSLRKPAREEVGGQAATRLMAATKRFSLAEQIAVMEEILNDLRARLR